MLVQETAAVTVEVSHWRLTTRLAFRFSFAFFLLHDKTLVPADLVSLVASRVFRATRPFVTTGSSSGDETFDW
jgi:hypothetical protein